MRDRNKTISKLLSNQNLPSSKVQLNRMIKRLKS